MAYSIALCTSKKLKGMAQRGKKKILFLSPTPLLCYKHLLIEQLSFEL